VNLQDALYRVRPQVLGCPEPIIIDALRQAAETLCRDSHVWQEKLWPISTYGAIGHYRVPLPAYARLVSPQRVQFDGQWLEYRHADALERLMGVDWRSAQAGPQYWTMESANTIRLVPQPGSDAADALVIWASLEPAEHAVELPDWFRQYDSTLTEGALAALKEMPQQQWSAPKMAQEHRRRFKVQVANARYHASRGFSDRPLRTKVYP